MWGEKDTSITFCENKYEKIEWIAEYYNTISSFFYIIFAVPFIGTKINKIALSGVGVGIGSIILHGTMRYYGQWIDEISILCYGFYTLQYLEPIWPNALLHMIIAVYLGCWKNFLIFTLFFIIIEGRILFIIYRTPQIKIYLYPKLICFGVGFSNWLLDQFACEYIKDYQLHYVWHLFSSLTMFVSMNMLIIG